MSSMKYLLREFVGVPKRSIGDLCIFVKHRPRITDTPWEKRREVSELREFGVTKLAINFQAKVAQLRNTYLNGRLDGDSVNRPSPENGVPTNIFASLRNDDISSIVSDVRLLSILQALYGRTPYLRSDPQVHRFHITADRQRDDNFCWHVDRYQQITLMVLLNKVTEATTHMMYLKGTHRRTFGFWNLRMQRLKSSVEVPKKYRDREVIRLLGDPGDAYLFDSMGLHRANYITGTVRDTVFALYTNGHNLYAYRALNSKLADETHPFYETFNRQAAGLIFADGYPRNLRYFKSRLMNKL